MMDSEVQNTDLYSRVIHQLRQIRVDLLLLTEQYVEAHGLHNISHFDFPGGTASMDSDTWAVMAMEERLLANITAYLDLERRLIHVIEEQADSLLQGEGDLHSGLHSILRQVSALRSQLEHLGTTVGLKKELDEDLDVLDASSGGAFERKVRGFHVLKQLANWTLRSIRDLRKLQVEKGKLAMEADTSAESSQ